MRPRPQYTGGIDTWISDEQRERNRDNAGRETLRYGGKPRISIPFDLAATPNEHAIHKAVLRMNNAGYPCKENEEWRTHLLCYRVTSPWNTNANWLEHTQTNYNIYSSLRQ